MSKSITINGLDVPMDFIEKSLDIEMKLYGDTEWGYMHKIDHEILTLRYGLHGVEPRKWKDIPMDIRSSTASSKCKRILNHIYDDYLIENPGEHIKAKVKSNNKFIRGREINIKCLEGCSVTFKHIKKGDDDIVRLQILGKGIHFKYTDLFKMLGVMGL